MKLEDILARFRIEHRKHLQVVFGAREMNLRGSELVDDGKSAGADARLNPRPPRRGVTRPRAQGDTARAGNTRHSRAGRVARHALRRAAARPKSATVG